MESKTDGHFAEWSYRIFSYTDVKLGTTLIALHDPEFVCLGMKRVIKSLSNDLNERKTQNEYLGDKTEHR